MRRLIGFLLLAAIVIGVAWWIAFVPGHVRAEFGRFTLETSAPVAILGLIATVVAILVVLRLLFWLLNLPRLGRRWIKDRRQRHGEASVTRTLVALAAGEIGDARREARHARRRLGDTPQTLLLAASAARLGGREDEAEIAFRALAARPDAAFLGLRGLLQQAITRGDWEQAAELARRAEAASPGAAWLRAERAQLAVRTGAWTEALALTDEDTPRAALATAAAEAEADPDRALALARQAWTADPALAPAAIAYARRLRAGGRENRALEVLRKSWEKRPHPDIAAFALAPIEAPAARARQAQLLVRSNPAHAETHLLLARASLDAGLIGDARKHIEQARALGIDQRRLWLLASDLAQAEFGDTEQGRTAQRDALRRAATAAADPVWRCGQCTAVAPSWQPVCPSCGAAGRLAWGTAVTPDAQPPNAAKLGRASVPATLP